MAINVTGSLPGLIQGAVDWMKGAANQTPKAPQQPGSIQEFLATMHDTKNGYQLSKPFLYDVVMTLPITSPSGDMLRMFCHSASLPGYNVQAQPNKIYGLPFSVPYEMNYEPISFTFYVDRSLSIPKTFIDYREDKMFDKDSFSPKYYKDMVFPTDIYVYDADNKTIAATYHLENCFFMNVSSMNLNAAAQNQVQEVTVTLVFETMNIEYQTSTWTGVNASNVVTQKMDTLINKTGMVAPLNFDTFKNKFPDLASKFNIGSTLKGLQSTAKITSPNLSGISLSNLFS